MDLDLGTYERFLDITISREANITTGQVYGKVIDRERRGDFLGRCVQIIPHVTDEIKLRIRKIAEKNGVDVLLIECGGTVGDIEGLPFYEAFRQLRLEEGSNKALFLHVSLVPILDVTKEQKSKTTQHSVQELRRIGLQPDIIVVRCRDMLDPEPRRKIALFGSVDERAVFSSPNVESIYELPLVLDSQSLGDYVCEKLELPIRVPMWDDWRSIVESFKNAEHTLKIAVCGKYTKLADSYISINEALKQAGAVTSSKVTIDWIGAETFEKKPDKIGLLCNYDGILVPGGFGNRGVEGKISAIRFARENNVPFLGICLGFQLATVEYARNVCSLEDTNSTEFDTNTPHPVINLLPEQEGVEYLGGTMRLGASPIRILKDTIAHRLYRSDLIYERHRHRYEVNPKYLPLLLSCGLIYSGESLDKVRMEILELKNHYFFFATQFHPEFKSRPGKPDPTFYGFIKSSLDKKLGLPNPIFDEEIFLSAEAKYNRK